MIAPIETAVSTLEEENVRLRREREQWGIEKRILELKIDKLQRQLWGKKSERMPKDDQKQKLLFAEPPPQSSASEASRPVRERFEQPRAPRTPKGPKRLDPSLRREVIAVPAPDLQELICPVTKKPMQPGFVEHLEVLARRPPEYYVKRYERAVFVSGAKTAPVYSPWPADVLPKARMHASVVAHIAAAHYCEHQPYHRIEKHLARIGVELPRVCQVSLMEQLDRIVEPLMKAHKADVFSDGYIQVDATPIRQYDPAKPGKVSEATLWVYRAKSGAVWFEHQGSKSTKHPDATLREVNFRGFCQTDGASGLNNIGPPGQVRSLGCFTHVRRPFFKAHQAGDPRALWYLEHIGKLFRVERIAKRYTVSIARKQRLRQRFSLPILQTMLQQAEVHAEVAPAKTDLGDAVRHLLNQQQRLKSCLTVPEAEISTNAAERAIRPLKIGAKNWLYIGDPSAGPRLANLFTLVENCRLLGLDPERYLIDLIARLPEHPATKITELLPRHWLAARAESVASG